MAVYFLDRLHTVNKITFLQRLIAMYHIIVTVNNSQFAEQFAGIVSSVLTGCSIIIALYQTMININYFSEPSHVVFRYKVVRDDF